MIMEDIENEIKDKLSVNKLFNLSYVQFEVYNDCSTNCEDDGIVYWYSHILDGEHFNIINSVFNKYGFEFAYIELRRDEWIKPKCDYYIIMSFHKKSEEEEI